MLLQPSFVDVSGAVREVHVASSTGCTDIAKDRVSAQCIRVHSELTRVDLDAPIANRPCADGRCLGGPRR